MRSNISLKFIASTGTSTISLSETKAWRFKIRPFVMYFQRTSSHQILVLPIAFFYILEFVQVLQSLMDLRLHQDVYPLEILRQSGEELLHSPPWHPHLVYKLKF